MAEPHSITGLSLPAVCLDCESCKFMVLYIQSGRWEAIACNPCEYCTHNPSITSNKVVKKKVEEIHIITTDLDQRIQVFYTNSKQVYHPPITNENKRILHHLLTEILSNFTKDGKTSNENKSPWKPHCDYREERGGKYICTEAMANGKECSEDNCP